MTISGRTHRRQRIGSSRVERLALSKLREGLSWPQWTRLRHSDYSPVLRGRILQTIRTHCPVEVRRMTYIRNGACADVRDAHAHMWRHIVARGWLRLPERGEPLLLIVSADKRRLWGGNETIGLRVSPVVDTPSCSPHLPGGDGEAAVR